MKIPAKFFNAEYGAILNLLNEPPKENIERIKILSFFWHIEALVSDAAGSGDEWVPFSANLAKLQREGKVADDLRLAFMTIGKLRNLLSHRKNEPELFQLIKAAERAIVEAWKPAQVSGKPFFETLAASASKKLGISVAPDNWGGAEFQELFGSLFAALLFAIAVNQFTDDNKSEFPLKVGPYSFGLT